MCNTLKIISAYRSMINSVICRLCRGGQLLFSIAKKSNQKRSRAIETPSVVPSKPLGAIAVLPFYHLAQNGTGTRQRSNTYAVLSLRRPLGSHFGSQHAFAASLTARVNQEIKA